MAQSVPVAARRGVQRPDDAVDSEDADDGGIEEGRRDTHRWRGVAGLALLAVGFGLLLEAPAVLLAGVAGVAAAAASATGRAPEPELALERSVDDPDPDPDEEVRVAVTVRNESGRALPDLRLVDGVPDGLAVVDGSPRLATALRDGERATFEYVLRARLGRHEFEPLTAIARDLAGTSEFVATVESRAASDEALATNGGTARVDATEEGGADGESTRDVDERDGDESVRVAHESLRDVDEPGGHDSRDDPRERDDGTRTPGDAVRTAANATRSVDAIVCSPAFSADPIDFPLRPQTTRFTGRTTSDEGGTGVEFHATRAYRPGDPVNRIDWRRTARTGELTTVDFRRERAAEVLLVVDARPEAAVAPDPHAGSALERSLEAAHEVAASLLAAGHGVGLAAIAAEPCWLAPGRGAEHRVELRDLFAGAAAFRRRPPEEDVNVYGAVRSIRQRIAGDAQVVFCTPLADDGAADAALRFDAHGHATTVVSPDPTVESTIGNQAAALGRETRVGRVRRAGLPVIDWAREEPIERALARSRARWSA